MTRRVFSDLWLGDRFTAPGVADSQWTKVSHETARRHSPHSTALGPAGWGYTGDAVCSFAPQDPVDFVPVQPSVQVLSAPAQSRIQGATGDFPGLHWMAATLAFAAVTAACVTFALVPHLVGNAPAAASELACVMSDESSGCVFTGSGRNGPHDTDEKNELP